MSFDVILENIKAVVLASTLKTAMMISIDFVSSMIMGKARNRVKEVAMRKAKCCKWLKLSGASDNQTFENKVFSSTRRVRKKHLDSEDLDISMFFHLFFLNVHVLYGDRSTFVTIDRAAHLKESC